MGGTIQALYPFEEEAAVICSDEGKLNGMELNRALYDEDGKIYDIIAGPFLICGLDGDCFGSLPDDLISKFSAGNVFYARWGNKGIAGQDNKVLYQGTASAAKK